MKSIFGAYHKLEKDISSAYMLKKLAVDAGIDAAEVEEWLGLDVAADIVDEEARLNKKMMKSGYYPLIFNEYIRLTNLKTRQSSLRFF